MKIHFRDRPWDLYATIVYTVGTAGILLELGVGNPLALLLLFLAPGYVLGAALFPNNEEFDWIERLALSCGLSIAVVPLIGFLLNFTPWGIRFVPTTATITLFTVCVCYLAHWRRMRLSPERRLAATINLRMPGWTGYSALDKGLTIAVAASMVVAGSALAYVVLTPPRAETFTVFYLLGPGGKATGYPSRLNISQNGSVFLGIVNNEAVATSYTARIDLVGLQPVSNATSGVNQTVEVNRTTVSSFNVTLYDGQNWTHLYTFSIAYSGLWKVQFLLFRNGDTSLSYRELHLFVRVQ